MMYNDVQTYVIVQLFTARNVRVAKLITMQWNIGVLFAKHSLVNWNSNSYLYSCRCEHDLTRSAACSEYSHQAISLATSVQFSM